MSQVYLLDVGALSHVGRVREINEDSVGIFDEYKKLLNLSGEVIVRKGQLYAVADGMGGHASGEVASRKAIEILFSHYYEDMDVDLGRSLEQAFWAANAEIYAQAAANSEHLGMGTTLVAAIVQGDEVIIANVGDSRAYLIKNGQSRQISRDHSWVSEQVDAGLLTEEEAQEHVYRNIITRSMGGRPDVDVDTFSFSLELGDAILLCTDGLSNEVPPIQIAQMISDSENSEEAVGILIDLANARGGSDNSSAVLIKAVEAIAQKSSLPWIAVGAMVALLVFGILGLCISAGPLAGYVVPQFSKPTHISTGSPMPGAGFSAETKVLQPVPSSIIPTSTPARPTSIIPSSPDSSSSPTSPPVVLTTGPAESGQRASATRLPVFGWEIVPPTPQ